MIDGSEKCNRQLAFTLHNSHVCEKRCKVTNHLHRLDANNLTNETNVEVTLHNISAPHLHMPVNTCLTFFFKNY